MLPDLRKSEANLLRRIFNQTRVLHVSAIDKCILQHILQCSLLVFFIPSNAFLMARGIAHAILESVAWIGPHNNICTKAHFEALPCADAKAETSPEQIWFLTCASQEPIFGKSNIVRFSSEPISPLTCASRGANF